jgi:polyisoprenoid-binding protein YceI
MTVQPAPSRRGPILAILAVVVLAVAAGGLWYLFLRPAGPAPVSLSSAAPTLAPPSEASGGAGAASTEAPAGTAAPGGGGIAGTWTVDPSVGSFSDFSGSFVGYRVRETLANIGATEAVGRTPDVTGTITVEGTTIAAAEFTADLSTLESDDNRRDGQLRQQALETSQLPTATFTLTAPVELGSEPADGATVDVTATGDLTLHGVTKSVEVTLQARVSGGVVTIAGSLPIVFADFGIQKPESMMVLSVEDNGVMELQLQLTRA